MFKKFLITSFPYLMLLVIAAILFTFTARGNIGNPTPLEIDTVLNSNGQPFESSQERSRYAMILSLYHDKTVAIDNFASMGTPDIGFINGHYYSFFPPAASIIALPFFIIGQQYELAQMAVFLVPTLFSIATMLLIIKFCKKLGLGWSTALFAAIAFGFATNAWGYSVTFYAHIISSFFILLGLYSTVFLKNWKGALLFWLSYSIGVFIDFPNLFIFLPLAVVQAFRFFSLSQQGRKFDLKLKWQYFFTPFLFIALMGAYGYYNYHHFGDPTILSNTIPRVRDLKDANSDLYEPEGGKDAVGALHTRNMLEGFRSFMISTDRGLLFYTPIAFLAIVGLGVLSRKQKDVEVLLLAVPLTCLTLYTMFGDPYGGWAFGSRYIMSVLPELTILAALGLAYRQNIWVKILYSLVFAYSATISLLAPLTTNVIPPLVEARDLGLKASYIINIDMLKDNHLNSFFYNHVLNESIDGMHYFATLASFIVIVGLILIWIPKEKLSTYEK